MNIYYTFYCRAFDWYNTNEGKNKDSLRLSAIFLITAMPNVNLVSVLIVFGVLINHTPINKWAALLLTIATLIFNLLLINSKKSDSLREEYASYDERKKKRISFYFFLYLIISAVLLLISMAYVAYYKHKYGNYDLPG
jgi:hypothetical protein